jgi:hypothetical protein
VTPFAFTTRNPVISRVATAHAIVARIVRSEIDRYVPAVHQVPDAVSIDTV